MGRICPRETCSVLKHGCPYLPILLLPVSLLTLLFLSPFQKLPEGENRHNQHKHITKALALKGICGCATFGTLSWILPSSAYSQWGHPYLSLHNRVPEDKLFPTFSCLQILRKWKGISREGHQSPWELGQKPGWAQANQGCQPSSDTPV